MSWLGALWGAVEHAAEDVGHGIESAAHSVETAVHDGIGEASTILNDVGDTLHTIDDTIHSIPVVSQIYDLTPLATAVELGDEWAHVGGEFTGDLEGEMEGRHADWGHLARRAGEAALDTGIAGASMYAGGAFAGRALGRQAGAAARLGGKTLGRDIAGELGSRAGVSMAERSLGRRVADYGARSMVAGAGASVLSVPAKAAQHQMGADFEDRHAHNSVGVSSGRYGQTAAHGSYPAINELRERGYDTTHVGTIMNTSDDRPAYIRREPQVRVSRDDQMQMQKAREMGQAFVPPPIDAVWEPPSE